MSFLNADLPSSDEEDDDYRPDQDKTAPKEDRAELAAGQPNRGEKRSRGPGEQDELTIEELAANDQYDPRKRVRKARIDQLWQILNSKPGSGPQASPSGPGRPLPPSNTSTPGPNAQPGPAVGPSATVSLATLCRTVGAKERKKTNTDVLWMRSLGLTPPANAPSATPSKPSALPNPGQHPASAPPKVTGLAGTDQPRAAAEGSTSQQPSSSAAPAAGAAAAGAAEAGSNGLAPESRGGQGAGPSGSAGVSDAARAAAAAALAAVREGGGVGAVRLANKVTVMETRRFAGKDIQVAVQVDRNSKEALKAAEKAARPPPPTSGLDAFLAEVEKKKKVNVLDKTKADWQQFKASDTTLEEELEAHRRSGGQYLDKVDFLKRAELREYETERDLRLSSDVRNRGRM